MARIDELKGELCADPLLWWLLQEAMPTTLSPWISAEWVHVHDITEVRARCYAHGRFAAQVVKYESTGRYGTALRSEKNPEGGMVDFRHDAASFEEGMDMVDAELRRLGYLLVPGPVGVRQR